MTFRNGNATIFTERSENTKSEVIALEDAKTTGMINEREDRGLSELRRKYGKLILKVCRGVLRSAEDAEECANDTLLAVWEGLERDDPANLTAYICRIARRSAVSRLRYNKAQMRNSDQLTELDECIPSGVSVESQAEMNELSEALNSWIKTLNTKNQKLFMGRYFYGQTVKEAARSCSMTVTAATTALSRMRSALKKYLVERGMFDE